jgi:hypothetical protein
LPLDALAWSSAIAKLVSDPPASRPGAADPTHGSRLLAIYRALLAR